MALFDSLLVDATVALISLLILLYFYFEYKFTYWKKRGVPFLKPLPIVGNFKDVLLQWRSPSHFFEDLYNGGRGKPLLGFYIFGRPSLLVRDPAIIKNVLVKDFNVFFDRHIECDAKTDPLGHLNLFVIKGKPWRHIRSKLTPIFTSGKMRNMFPLIVNCTVNLKEYLKGLSESSKSSIEVKETMSKFTTDVISSCAYGIEANSLKDPDAEFRNFGRYAFTFSFFRTFEMMVMFFFPSFVKLGKFKFFSNVTTGFLRKIFWDVILTREKNYVKSNDLINLLIQLKNKGSIEDDSNDLKADEKIMDVGTKINEFTGDTLVAQAAVFFTAGFETTATTLSFCMYELALSPDIQTRLRQEILDVMSKNEEITYDSVQGMTYLDMVVSAVELNMSSALANYATEAETLRKYTPFAFLDRVCSKDYVEPVTGTIIEKGTTVYMSLHGLHTDPEYFPEPERFDPERFSEENKRSITPYTYLPFGEGPHNCIGSRFGLMSVKCCLTHILSEYEVLKCPETPFPLQYSNKSIVLASTGGIPLKFKRIVAP
uniref:Cytochrome P450 n=1 Tax=Timema shepardi TaxID=629360 RepID=A0A7R9ATM7_TIMSH|nr:unnamed protein product [Timema shepardi]